MLIEVDLRSSATLKESLYTSLRRDPVLGVGFLCNLIIRIGGHLCC